MIELAFRDQVRTDKKEKYWSEYSILLLMISAASLLIFFIYGLENYKIIFDHGFGTSSYIIFGALIALPSVSYYVRQKFPAIGFYLLSVTFLIYFATVLASLYDLFLLVLSTVSFLSFTALWRDAIGHENGKFKRFTIFISANVFMYLVSKLLIFAVQPQGFPMTFVQIGSVFATQFEGVPFLFSHGFAVYTPYFVFMVSPLSLIIFTAISALLTENYIGIFRYLMGRSKGTNFQSAVYGVASTLSCQCEGCISLLPTMTVLILTIAMIPLLVESFILLLATQFLLKRFFSKSGRVRFLSSIDKMNEGSIVFIAVSITTVFLLVYEMVGIYLGQINNIFFFFGVSMAMILVGYADVIVYSRYLHFRKRKSLPLALISAGSVLGVIWFIPSLTFIAFSNPEFFALMSSSSLVTGVLFGLARTFYSPGGRKLVDEYLALMLGMIPIIVLYVSSTFNVLLWPEFGINQQVEFSIAAWGFILPLMWLTTNLSLNSASDYRPYVDTPVGPENDTVSA